MRIDRKWIGTQVQYTGEQCYRTELFRYKALFGNEIYTVKETRSDCCNLYLILDGIAGAYNSKMFRQIPPTPP